jgi:hypothetical protein
MIAVPVEVAPSVPSVAAKTEPDMAVNDAIIAMRNNFIFITLIYLMILKSYFYF